MSASRQAFRASFLHLLDDPGTDIESAAVEYVDDGVLVVEEGRIAAMGPADKLLGSLP